VARMTRKLDQPLDQAVASTRHIATELGWKIVERKSDATTLVFRKRTVFAWVLGTTFTVWFESVSPTQTRVTVFTKEKFQGHTIQKLFDALGAHLH
jgi:hypothetical protein